MTVKEIEALFKASTEDTAPLRERIAELEAALRRMHASVPGGSICDPQQIADELRHIAADVGVDVEQ